MICISEDNKKYISGIHSGCVAEVDEFDVEYPTCFFQGIETLLNWINMKVNCFFERIEQRVEHNNAQNITWAGQNLLFLLCYWFATS